MSKRLTPDQRDRALRLAGIKMKPAKPKKAPAPERLRFNRPRSFDHAAMRAWREFHGVSEEEHRRKLMLSRGDIEVRSTAPSAEAKLLRFRTEASAAAGSMVGYFALFNNWTAIDSVYEGRFLERVAPGAFARSLRENTIRVLLEHGKDPMLGNKPIARPDVLREDETGAYVEARLFDGVPEIVRSGLAANVYGASFRFRVRDGGEQWSDNPARSAHNPDGLPERTLTDVHLSEFGPVTFGAYPEAGLTVA